MSVWDETDIQKSPQSTQSTADLQDTKDSTSTDNNRFLNTMEPKVQQVANHLTIYQKLSPFYTNAEQVLEQMRHLPGFLPKLIPPNKRGWKAYLNVLN